MLRCINFSIPTLAVVSLALDFNLLQTKKRGICATVTCWSKAAEKSVLSILFYLAISFHVGNAIVVGSWFIMSVYTSKRRRYLTEKIMVSSC